MIAKTSIAKGNCPCGFSFHLQEDNQPKKGFTGENHVNVVFPCSDIYAAGILAQWKVLPGRTETSEKQVFN